MTANGVVLPKVHLENPQEMHPRADEVVQALPAKNPIGRIPRSQATRSSRDCSLIQSGQNLGDPGGP